MFVLGGDDVMLLVLTDRPEPRLRDTKQTKGFGQKVCLYWDHGKQKFFRSKNYDAMVWIRDFLEQFGMKVKLKTQRIYSLRRSASKLYHRGKVSGMLGFLF